MMYIDQLNRKIKLPKRPERIISLVPSQTELLVSLGLIDRIVGITKFCVHPTSIKKQKTIVGGTKKIRYETIKKLNPDIILCNKEENTKEIVSLLEEGFPVHVSDITSISDALQMIKQYGAIFSKEEEALDLISRIKIEKELFEKFVSKKKPKKVAYFIWKDPWMSVGNHTFINEMLKINGFINAFEDKTRYPEIKKNEMSKVDDLDVIMLSSEPFPFSEKHIEEVKGFYPNADVILVDGEYFSWYGSRMVEAFTYFRSLH